MNGAQSSAATSRPEGELVAATRPPPAVIEAALAGEFTIIAGDTTTLERVLLDTFDGRLRAKGWVLRWEAGRLVLTGPSEPDSGAAWPLAEEPAELPAAPVAPDRLPEGDLRRALNGTLGGRALIPLARLRITSQTLAVLDPLQKTVARLRIDSPELLPVHGRPIELETRVYPVMLRGYEEELARSVELVVRGLGLGPAQRPLHDEAVLRAGRRPEGVSSKVRVALSAQDRADVAVVRVLRRLLEVYDANLPGVLADVDADFLHDLRVSVRRTRTVQRQLRGVFPPGELQRLRDEFHWLQRVTGEARDLDVQVRGFAELRRLTPAPVRGDLDPVLLVLGRRRLLAHGVMERELRGDRAAALRRDWEALLEHLVGLPEDARPDAATPIVTLSGRRIARVYRKLRKAGGKIDSDSPPEAYHELRKRAKELRYLLELFGRPLHDDPTVKPMTRTLKRLQDVLGRHQDRNVQVRILREVGDEVSTLPGGGPALLACGALIERLEADASAARAEFANVFAEFSAKPQRRLIEKTFAP